MSGPGGHIVLVGLPGAGKSTVGQLLARELGRPFLDFDEEIVRRSGQSITGIFAVEGEPAFRAMEAELTREVATAPAAVLSPGGGWAAQPGLVDLLRPPALIVHLAVSPATAIARLATSSIERPLLRAGDPLAAAIALSESRRAAYAAADLVVDTEGLAPERVTDRVLSLIGRSA